MCNAALCIAKQDDFAPAIFLVFSLLEDSALLYTRIYVGRPQACEHGVD